MPANVVSDAVLDIAFSDQGRLPLAANIVHPHPILWRVVFTNLQKALMRYKNLSKDGLPIVPFAEWVSKLTEYAQGATEDDMQRIVGAFSLLDV